MSNILFGGGRAQIVTVLPNATHAKEQTYEDVHYWKVAYNGILVIRGADYTTVMAPEEWKKFHVEDSKATVIEDGKKVVEGAGNKST